MSGRRTAAALLAGAALLAAPAALAGTAFLETLGGIRAGSPDGDARLVRHFHDGLVRPPGRVDPAARAACARYLPPALARIEARGAAGCPASVEALEALVMCRMLAGDRKDAAALMERLARVRCASPQVEGMQHAMSLASRWLWPEPLEALVAAQERAPGAPSEVAARRERLRVAAERRRAMLDALGDRAERSGLLVVGVVPDSPGARAGLRRGDVILTARAQPLHSPEDLAARVGEGQVVGILTMRDRMRIETHLRGGSAGLELVPVPEVLVEPPAP